MSAVNQQHQQRVQDQQNFKYTIFNLQQKNYVCLT